MSKRWYMAVPFSEKDVAKAIGARWDRDRRQWYFDDMALSKHPEAIVWTSDKKQYGELLHDTAKQFAADPEASIAESPIWATETGSKFLADVILLKLCGPNRKKSVVTNKEPGHG